ncbi:hypothetical protein R1sor_012719 [Riccia sorocarpa]|uniref:SET domain-containing protein n=1 Tax=Riccia sorocarpa TaxID=122646 RepID=A0ABD3I4K6_9MARC
MSEVNDYAKSYVQYVRLCLNGGAGRRRLRETSSSSTSGTSQTGSYDADQSGDESAAALLPQRPRLDDARLPVTCHCAKCKGLTTKTAIEAERHIQQWGRHNEGESSRAASGRRREVQSRSRPAVRDILRHSFIQFSLSAIQDFATQLRTNRARTPMPQPIDPKVFRRALETMDISALFTPRTSVPASSAVPPPDLARHAQPEPEVEPEVDLEVDPMVDPSVDPVVEPEVEHIMEPTASVKSHHPSTEVHGIVGESIVVVERYVAPHRDDAPEETRPSLFPYVGCHNLAGYINNVIGTRPLREPNVMWVLIEDPPYGRRDLEFHVATVPTRPIQAGDELLCDYPWGSGYTMCIPSSSTMIYK